MLVNVGKACQEFHNNHVVSVAAKKVQCDEIWSFVYAKAKNVPEGMENEAGDVWTWTAIDADSKLIISWLVGSAKNEKRYSPAECIGAKKVDIYGNPNHKDISTSYVERQNLTMRMHMRRFTRLTNAFSKKIENHCYAIALHFVYYNFSKIHKTLRVTPAMEAGLTNDIMEIEDIVKLTD